jgi:hypothetical protein
MNLQYRENRILYGKNAFEEYNYLHTKFEKIKMSKNTDVSVIHSILLGFENFQNKYSGELAQVPLSSEYRTISNLLVQTGFHIAYLKKFS